MANKRQKIADKDRYSIIVPNFKSCMVCGSTNQNFINKLLKMVLLYPSVAKLNINN